MVRGIRAIYDDGKVEFLEKEPRGKYAAVVVFLETLSKDEIEDLILAKQLGLEKDYEKAIAALPHGELKTSEEIKAKIERKQGA